MCSPSGASSDKSNVSAHADDIPSPTQQPPPERASAWTIPLLCAGIAVLACCLLIPAADDNRKLVWERERLKADLEQIQKQIDVNGRFLKSVADDPTLLERLAQRQMKMVREGTAVLALREDRPHGDMSPYLLLSVPPPQPLPEYRPVGGGFSNLCRHPRSRLFLMGGAMLLVACGLVLGSTPSRS
jgi:hypothetical protein